MKNFLASPIPNLPQQIRVVKFDVPNKLPAIKTRSLSPNPVISNKKRSLSPNTPNEKKSQVLFDNIVKKSIKKQHIIIINELLKKSESFASLLSNLEGIKAGIKICFSKINEKKDFVEFFEIFLHKIKNLKSPKFLAMSSLICGKILYRFNNYQESLKFLKIARSALYSLLEVSYKYRIYKYISLCFVKMKCYDQARKYALKLLKLSLIFQNIKYESYAYDLLGKIYFYISELEMAHIYHEKMLNCSKVSEMRNIGALLKNKYFEKQSLRKKEPPMTSSEEEDFDLLDNFNHKKSFGLKHNQKAIFSHLSNERGDPKENLNEFTGDMKKSLKKIVLKILEQSDAKKRTKKLKEFYARSVKYAKEKLIILLNIINQTPNFKIYCFLMI